jgi:hypothetical protein
VSSHLIYLVLALAAGELVHNLIESQEVRKKVKWLGLGLTGKPYKDNIPFKIDTRAKSYALSLIGLVITTAIFYLIFSILKLSDHKSLEVVVVLLILAYVVTAVILDKYHVEIARLTPKVPSENK